MNWTELENEVKHLASIIDYVPDIIVAIVQRGIIPARLLSSYLGVPAMYCLNVRKTGDDRRITSEIWEDIQGKKILLIEDMLETGKSLIVAKAYLEGRGSGVKTACLYTMAVSEIQPDYFVKTVSSLQAFPWE